MDIPPSAYTAIGAISAAIIAGGISFISTVLAKEQKTSEFRQAWIDGLRDDIAEEISLFNTIIASIRSQIDQGKSGEEIREYLLKKEDSICKLELVEARIKLRINPNEHEKFIQALSNLEKFVKDKQGFMDRDASRSLIDELCKESQTILKKEWVRVKRGESIYVVTKWTSLFIFVVSLLAGIGYASNLLLNAAGN